MAPTVFDEIASVAPAFGPPVMWMEYPRRSRASVRFVVIVEVVPAVAVPLGPTDVAVPHAPTANVPARAPDGICTQASSWGLYKYCTVALTT